MNKGLWLFIGLFAASAAFGNIGGYCAAVDVEGDHAFVGAGQILLSVDVADSANPSGSGSLYLPGLIEDVLVDGTTLYAACGDAGVHKVDISDPLNMELLTTYDSSGHAYGLARSGASLYLADGVSGLRELDAASLALTGSYRTNAPAMDVVVEGSSIYLLDHFNGLIGLDAALNETGSYGMIAFGNRMASDGASLYVTDGEGKVTQVTMATMALVTNQLVGIPTLGIAVEGSDVFVARGDAGVQVLNGAVLPTIGSASGLAVGGGKLYIADGFGGLSIFDAASKNLLGSYSAVSRSRSAAIAGGHAYLAAGNNGVRIFDLADLSPVASVGCSNALDVAVADGLLLVADAFQGLELFNLSSPTNPAHLGTFAAPTNAPVRRVGASGPFAYIAEGYTLHKLDVSIPASPVLAKSYVSPEYIFDLEVSGTHVLLATGGELQVLSSDLVPLSGTSATGVQTVTADGADALAGWNYMDLSDPLTPVAVTNFGALVRAMQLTLSGEKIYASADDGGTAIIPLPAIGSDSDGDGLDDALEQLIIDFDPNDDIENLADVNPDDDFDSDGQSNIHEQVAGTSLVDPDSLFAICGLEGEGSGFAVSWYSCAGHTYTVHKSTNLMDGFTVLKSGISATEPINTHIDSEAGECAMYMITIDP